MKVLGITDERNECDCCGKKNLKCTVALEHTDADGNGTGSIVYFGRDCAARKIYGNNKSGNVKSVEALGKAIEYARKWLRHTDKHTARLVGDAIRCRFTRVHEVGKFSLQFDNGVTVSKD